MPKLRSILALVLIALLPCALFGASLDATIASGTSGGTPASYLSDLHTSVVDTGRIGLTWFNGGTLGQANIVPSETGTFSGLIATGGGNEFVQTGGTYPTAYTKFSIYLAFKFSSVTGSQPIIFSTGHEGSNTAQSSVYIPDSTHIAVTNGIRTAGGTSFAYTWDTNPHDILVTFDIGTIMVYIDGVQIGQATGAGNPVDNQNWVWGNAYGSGFSANGNYQRMAFFGSVLTSTDALTLHSAFLGVGVTITSPNGGNTFGTAQTIPITGTALGGITAVNVDYSANGSAGTPTWTRIASNVTVSSSAFSLNWSSPHTAGVDYWVRATDAGTSGATGESAAAFTIVTSTITVNNPLCSKVANYASAVTWSAPNVDGPATVSLSTDGGSTFPYTLATVTSPAQGFARFWITPGYVSTQCVIRVSANGVTGSTSAFSIVTESTAALQPVMTAGAGSSAISGSGSGAKPNADWAVVKGESWTGTRLLGVAAASARTDPSSGAGGDTSPGIECIKMRAKGGTWVFVPQPSLNTIGVRAVDWTPAAYPSQMSAASQLIRATQEWCASLNASQFGSNESVTIQAIVYPYVGQAIALSDLTVVANPTAPTTYYISAASGTSGGAGTKISPIDTVANAVAKAITASSPPLTIVSIDGQATLSTGGQLYANPITITSDTGAWANTSIIAQAGSSTWQASWLHLKDIRVDFGANPTGTMGSTNQGGMVWLDGCEIFGRGYNSTDANSFNGFGELDVTECYIHDIGNAVGSITWATSARLLRNSFNYQSGGIQGGETVVALNYSVKNQLEGTGQHDDIFGFSQCLNKVVIGAVSDSGARPMAALVSQSPIRFAFVNCDFNGFSTPNFAGIGGNDQLIAYCRITGPVEYVDNPGQNSNQQFHANVFDQGIDEASATSEATWTYNDYGNGPGSVVAQDANATSGAQLTFNTNRTPAASNTNFNAGLPIWPYDAMNERRGLYTPSHWTAKGPYAAAAEYTPSAIGHIPQRIRIGIGIGF